MMGNSLQTMPDAVFPAANLRPSFAGVHPSTTRIFFWVTSVVPGVR
jgi:hypothetical protein